MMAKEKDTLKEKEEAYTRALSGLSGAGLGAAAGAAAGKGAQGAGNVGKGAKGFLSQGIQDLKDSGQTVMDDVHMILGTERGKMKEDYLDKKYPYRGGTGLKSGGKVKVSSASKRADGCAQRGKTKGRMV